MWTDHADDTTYEFCPLLLDSPRRFNDKSSPFENQFGHHLMGLGTDGAERFFFVRSRAPSVKILVYRLSIYVLVFNLSA